MAIGNRLRVLVLNAGSTSQKCKFFDLDERSADDHVQSAWSASIAWKTEKRGKIVVESNGKRHEEEREFESQEKALAELISMLWTGPAKVVESAEEVDVIGHRIVHGGSDYDKSVIIDDTVRKKLHELIELAPAHEPANILGINVAQSVFGSTPQVAVFDTAFHTSMPPELVVYPLPYQWYQDKKIRRYGFHGISHQYASGRCARLLGEESGAERIITCHLGGGCSLAAVAGGKSQYSSMGFTPLEGLMMGARCGSIDPGIILHLLHEGKLSVDEITTALNQESGLKGVSGVSKDMVEVMKAAEQGNVRAKLAFDMFVKRAAMQIASLLPVLGGLDALTFTGGIGENSARVREEICRQLPFLNVQLDATKNESGHGDRIISTDASSVATLVVYAQEEWAIAREIWAGQRTGSVA